MEKEKNERYVYCYEPYDGDSFIWDIKKDSKIEDLSECANVMNTLNEEAERWKAHKEWDCKTIQEQGDKLEELETRLSNCIEPKFKVGQEVWVVLDGVKKDVVENNWFLCSLEKSRLGLYEDYLFATEEEAIAKLEEIQNG